MEHMMSRVQRWFMPWRWGKRVRTVVLAAAAAAYLMSAVPVVRFARQKTFARRGSDAYLVIHQAYWPVWEAARRSSAIRQLIVRESRLMDDLLGREFLLGPSPSLWDL
jgi:hypothetical protein